MNLSELRKKAHIRICLEEEVEIGDPLFDDVHLIHQAVPKVNLEEIDASREFLGKRLDFPLVIAAMTGGFNEGRDICRLLAQVAEKKRIAFSAGSQRRMIERPESTDTYKVRDVAPNILLFGNIGITSLKKFSPQKIARAVHAIDADALCIHINPAQEIFQKGGDCDFSGCSAALKKLCDSIDVPVIGKEVGNGISRECAQHLKEVGVSAIDVGGFGGTSWIIVDSLHSGIDSSTHIGWGIPTAASILESKVGLPIIATGGIRNGLQMAKAIALGADLCGIALPFLHILRKKGGSEVEKYIDDLTREFKRTMFLTGCKNVDDLKRARFVLTGSLKEWFDQLEYRKCHIEEQGK